MNFDLSTSFIQTLIDLGFPADVAKVLWMPLPMILLIAIAGSWGLVATWLERKVSAAAQQRIGPEYIGAFGILAPVADVIKLVVKEDILPAKADALLFTLSPILVFVPIFVCYLLIPFGQQLILANLSIGVFFYIALSSITPIGLLMGGYASNNKYAILGGLRAAAQSISYEIPLSLAALAVILMSNSLSTVDIVQQQSSAGIFSWNIWRQPVGFMVFWIASIAECERIPFDLPEAEEELVAGYQTEYSGIKFMLFYGASYVRLALSALLSAVMYLGGWELPISVEAIASWFSNDLTVGWQIFSFVSGIIMTLLKAYILLFIVILLRWTVPRVRLDQLLNLGWKFLLPVSLVNLLATAALKLAFPIAFGG